MRSNFIAFILFSMFSVLALTAILTWVDAKQDVETYMRVQKLFMEECVSKKGTFVISREAVPQCIIEE